MFLKQQLFVVCVFALLKITSGQNPSPCPQIFSYEPKGTEEDRWYGVVSLQTPEDLDGVWLKIVLDRPAELLGNWFGESVSSDNEEFTVKNPKYRLEAGPPVSVRFFVKYNLAQTIPSVKSIRLNGKTICSARNEDSRPTTPTLHISQSVKPTGRPSTNNRPNNRPSVTGSNNNNNIGGTSSSTGNRRPSGSGSGSGGSNGNNNNNDNARPSGGSFANPSPSNANSNNGGNSNSGDFAVRPPTQQQPSRPSTTLQKREISCGTVATKASPLISYGQSTTQGQWPWHAALFHTQNGQFMYTCGGTLISETHVLTAAHCVARPQSNRPVALEKLAVYLGKYSLKKFGHPVQSRDIVEISIHPRYNHSFFFNDIAIIKLDHPADFDNFVRPCCLWEDSDISIENKLGTVVGWGFDEKRQISDSLMQAQMPVVSTTTCIYSNREFFSQFTNEQTYCAGFRNGTTVCNGDSGGGMVFPKPGTSGPNTVWQIRGLVSVGVALQGQGVCDPSHYIVFTDVSKHLQWIRQVLDRRD